ncbi:MAG: FKBP-type peptidyl-prolyl cis-trans isomerase [Burkholderiales bacterium]
MRTFLLSLVLAATLTAAGAASAQSRHVEFADSVPERIGTKTVAIDRVVGRGVESQPGQFVVIEYDAWVFDANAPEFKGHLFDSTRTQGHSLSVLLGVGRMIAGVDKGLLGMRVGGRRTLVIPPTMGYGARGAYDVPPNATLIFDVELKDVIAERNVN